MLLTRIVQFALPTLLSTAPPLLCVMIISQMAGNMAFLALGLGQALGGICSIVSTWGWDVNGPQRLRLMQPDSRAALLAESYVCRGVVLAVLSPFLVLTSLALAPEGFGALTLLTATAVATQGLSPTWWLAGVGRAGALVKYESGPRAAAAAVSAAVIVISQQPIWYPIITLGSMTVAYTVFLYRELTKQPLGWQITLTSVLASVRGNSRAFGISMSVLAYNTLSLPIVQSIASSAAVPYAAAGRLLTYWSLATITTNNALIGTIDEGSSAASFSARRKAAATLAVQSLVLGAAMFVLAPTLSRWLFDVTWESQWLGLWVALAFTLNGINTGLSKHVLIPEGRLSTVLKVSMFAAVLGLGLIVGLTPGFGAPGAMCGLFAAEASTFLLLLVASASTSRRRGVAHSSAQ